MEIRKVPFFDLLHFAGIIQLDELDPMGIIDLRHWGIVERKVTILPYPQATKVNGLRLEQIGITLTFIEWQKAITIKIMKEPRAYQLFDPLAHVILKASTVVGCDAQILIHVEQRNSGPIYPA